VCALVRHDMICAQEDELGPRLSVDKKQGSDEDEHMNEETKRLVSALVCVCVHACGAASCPCTHMIACDAAACPCVSVTGMIAGGQALMSLTHLVRMHS